MNAWLTLSGSRLYRLYARGQGGYGYLTEQARGGPERAITALLPMRRVMGIVHGFSFRCVEATPANLALAEWTDAPGVPPDALDVES